MRALLFVAATILLFSMNSFAQRIEEIRIRGGDLPYFIAKQQYKYPTFVRSKVYLNNGDSAAGSFNYNYFLQSIQFINETGDTLVISNEKDIKYIKIGTDTFFYDNGYYEWIASSATARLAVKHLIKSADAQKLGAFGIPTSTNKIESQDEVRGLTIQKLDIMEEIVFTKERIYYVSGIKTHFVEANKKNISKLFPKKDIDSYIKHNGLNLTKEEDLIELFTFINSPA